MLSRKTRKPRKKKNLDKRFITYLHKIEKDKLYYFILAHEQKGKVLIVNAPSGNEGTKAVFRLWVGNS